MDGWARAPTRTSRQIRGGRTIRSSRLRLCALRGGLGKAQTNLPPSAHRECQRSSWHGGGSSACRAFAYDARHQFSFRGHRLTRPASCPQSTHHAHDRSSSSCFNEMCRRLQIEERVKTACNGSKPTSSNKILKQNSTPLPV